MLNLLLHIKTFSLSQKLRIKPVFYIVILFNLLITSLPAQENLVPNGSFEDIVHCPIGTNDPGAVSLWYNPTMASPDYYNSCANNGGGVPWNDWGYQYAQDGEAYAGLGTSYILNNYREYLQIKLSHRLEADRAYCWSFWISLLDSIDFASNNIGIGLSTNTVTDFSSQSLLPINAVGHDSEINLDRNNWKKVSGVLTAIGDEEYLTIGNFFNDQNTSYLQVATNSIGGPAAYYFIDNVFLGNCGTEITVPNIITPNQDGINDFFSIQTSGAADIHVQIQNRWGNIVYKGDENTLWDGKYQGIECTEGVYFYVITYNNAQLDKMETKTGCIQLIR